VAGFLILGLIAWRVIDFGEFVRILRGLTPAWIAGLIGVCTVDRLLMGLKWRHLASAFGLGVRTGEYLKAYYAASFLGYCMPTTLGGDLYRGYRISRLSGRTPEVVASMVMEKLVGLTTNVLMAWVGLAFLVGAGVAPGSATIFQILFAATGVGLLVIAASFHEGVLRFGESLAGKIKLGRPVSKLTGAYRRYRSERTVLGANLVFCAVENGVALVLLLLSARALGLEMPAPAFLAIAAVNLFARRVAMVLESWGFSEVMSILTFGLVGIDGETAFAISIVSHACMALASLPGGIVLWRDRDQLGAVERKGEAAAPQGGGA